MGESGLSQMGEAQAGCLNRPMRTMIPRTRATHLTSAPLNECRFVRTLKSHCAEQAGSTGTCGRISEGQLTLCKPPSMRQVKCWNWTNWFLKVLGIVANVFETDKCGVFENRPSGEVRLWYCTPRGGRCCQPNCCTSTRKNIPWCASWRRASPPQPTTRLRRANGRHRFPGSCQGTSVPEFDQWAVSNGCDLELNIGIASARSALRDALRLPATPTALFKA